MACIWHMQAKLLDYPENSWVMLEGIKDENTFMLWLVSLHWAIQTLTTVGYGDISVGDTMEKLITIISIIAGTAVFSSAIGSVMSILEQYDSENQEL
jgi:hypothetical protein